MKKQKQNVKTSKGITLVALVITIIVMLILVAVTITMAINGGLFNYAGKAAGETKNAIDKEQNLASGKVTIGEKAYNSINEYLENKPSIENPPLEEPPIEEPETATIQVGDYISNYPVNYTNVATREGENEYIASDDFLGWRILSINENAEGKTEVSLVTAGVPVSIGDQSLDIDSVLSDVNIDMYFIDECGFDVGENTTLAPLFENEFTNGIRWLQYEDVEHRIESTKISYTEVKKTISDTEEAPNLFLIPSKENALSYASYWIGVVDYIDEARKR